MAHAAGIVAMVAQKPTYIVMGSATLRSYLSGILGGFARGNGG